jgi:hypothetical protein
MGLAVVIDPASKEVRSRVLSFTDRRAINRARGPSERPYIHSYGLMMQGGFTVGSCLSRAGIPADVSLPMYFSGGEINSEAEMLMRHLFSDGCSVSRRARAR